MPEKEIKFKYPIKGIFKYNIHLLTSPFKAAESGEIMLTKDTCKIRIGPAMYSIQNIKSIKNARANKYQIQSSIEIIYEENKVDQTLYIFDWKYFGFGNIFSTKGIDAIKAELDKFWQGLDNKFY